MTQDEERGFWLRRVEATGRAQARYLWLLLVTGLFFAALHTRAQNSEQITVHLIDLELNARTVLAAGAPIMAFLILAVMGAIRAWTRALHKIRGTSWPLDAEPLDTYPNALDLAVYTTDQTPGTLRNLLYFAYPLYLTGGLIEAAWLGLWVYWAPALSGRPIFLGAFAVTWVPATILVLGMWWARLNKLRDRKSAA